MDSTTIKFHSSLSEIADEWREIESSCPASSIQNNFLVLNAWYKCYADGKAMAFLSLWDKDLCIGIYPLTLEKKFGARIYNTLYRESFSISKPIIRNGFEEFFFDHLVRLLHVHKDKWDMIKFSSMYCFDNEQPLLVSSFVSNDADVYTIDDWTYAVKLQETFEQYCDTYLSKKTLTDLRRLEKKIAEREHTFLFHKDFEALPHMKRFYEMENTGWKKDAGTALVNSSNYLVYTDSFVHNCSLANKFVMTFLEIDGMKIAGQFGYLENGVYNLLRAAYDREYAKFAPSVLLFCETLRMLLDSHPEIKTINYYPISYGYKQKYSKDDCACSTHVLFSKSLKGRVLSRVYKRRMSRDK